MFPRIARPSSKCFLRRTLTLPMPPPAALATEHPRDFSDVAPVPLDFAASAERRAFLQSRHGPSRTIRSKPASLASQKTGSGRAHTPTIVRKSPPPSPFVRRSSLTARSARSLAAFDAASPRRYPAPAERPLNRSASSAIRRSRSSRTSRCAGMSSPNGSRIGQSSNT